MKIFFLNSLYSQPGMGGGITTYLRTISQELTKRGHEVRILTSGDQNYNDGKVAVVGLGKISAYKDRRQLRSLAFVFKRIRYMVNVYKYCRREKFCILESADGGFEHLLLCFIKTRSFKIITRLHGSTSLTKEVNFDKIITFLEGIAARKSDAISCPTDSYRLLCVERYRLKSNMITMIPCPIQLKPNYKKINVRKKYNIYRKKIILIVGLLSHRKGIDILGKVAEKFANHDNLVFVLLGNNIENFRMNTFPQNILYLGQKDQNELHSFYNDCEIFFTPSRFETFGIACAEAMAHGKAIVASDTAGLKDLVKDNINGYLFEIGNEGQAKEKIDILINDKKIQKIFGAKSKEMSQKYDLKIVANKTEKFYNLCLNSQ